MTFIDTPSTSEMCAAVEAGEIINQRSLISTSDSPNDPPRDHPFTDHALEQLLDFLLHDQRQVSPINLYSPARGGKLDGAASSEPISLIVSY